MDRTEFDKYLKERYEGQIKWNDGKAVSLKKSYTQMQISVIVLAATTTIASALASAHGQFADVGQWTAMVLSALITIISTILATFKHKETWLIYRTAAEALKREKSYYIAGIGDYHSADDREALFVQRVETILAGEDAEWLGIQRLKDEAAKPKTPANQ